MTIDELKRRTDIHELAAWLGIKRGPGGKKANYFRPSGEKNPSLTLFTNRENGQGWFKDQVSGESGSVLDFIMYARGCPFGEAVKMLHQYHGIPLEAPREERREKSRAEYIAERCLEEAERAIGYLVDERKLPVAIVRRAIERKTVGFNTWTSSKVASGAVGYGGPAAAFIVRGPNPGHVVAVDLRYLEPQLNGDVKTMTQGEKHGYFWCSDWKRFEGAHTVYVTEGAIDALTVEAAELPGVAAIATRGTGTVEGLDWRICAGKQVVLCFSNDKPFADGPKAGYCAGALAAWRAHELLTGLDISAILVDQRDWPWKDANELLQKERDHAKLRGALQKLEPWLIAGRPPRSAIKDPDDAPKRKARVFLPWQDEGRYGGFRVRPDFTNQVKEVEVEGENGDKETKEIWSDLAGFRIASLSRVSIASPTSTMTGDPDAQPTVMFSVSVQTPRHGAKLVRRVIEDEKLHNIDVWKKFGPVFSQGPFLRMVNILERTAHLGARNAVNFVGLAWRDGKLVVNEGPNCHFLDPKQQCPYYRLTFPSGQLREAREVIAAYQKTFHHNAGALALVWALGAHLKALLGFWPHLMMQARKGSGKSTLVKAMERTIAMTMFSGQSIETPFRILTSLSHTSQPVGWEELSARKMEVIQYATRMLQEAYQYTLTQRTAEMKEFLVSAPVLLAGEDVPVRDLIGKLIRTQLTHRKATPLPIDLPRFPVRQWLEFLTGLSRRGVLERHERARAFHLEKSMASGADDGAMRMASNYAAVRVAWELLCEFAELDVDAGGFPGDLLAEMNLHIKESTADREPWVWITETLLSEIAKNNFQYPFAWGSVAAKAEDDAVPELREQCLLVRTSHVMDHLASTNSLREKYNALPIKSDRVYKAELKASGVVVRDGVERTIGGYTTPTGNQVAGKRVSHLTALSIERLRRFGLHVVAPEDVMSGVPAEEPASAAP